MPDGFDDTDLEGKMNGQKDESIAMLFELSCCMLCLL